MKEIREQLKVGDLLWIISTQGVYAGKITQIDPNKIFLDNGSSFGVKFDERHNRVFKVLRENEWTEVVPCTEDQMAEAKFSEMSFKGSDILDAYREGFGTDMWEKFGGIATRLHSMKSTPSLITVLGWAHAEYCSALAEGQDIRDTDIPEMIERCQRDLNA